MASYPFHILDRAPKIESLSSDKAAFLPYINGNEPPNLFTERIGQFSVEGDRKIKFDLSNRRLLNKDILNQDLMIDMTEGIEHFVGTFADEKCDLDYAMQWLTHQNPIGTSLKEAVSESDFVVSSETLSQIAISPYGRTEYDNGVVLACTNLKGLFLIFAF